MCLLAVEYEGSPALIIGADVLEDEQRMRLWLQSRPAVLDERLGDLIVRLLDELDERAA